MIEEESSLRIDQKAKEAFRNRKGEQREGRRVSGLVDIKSEAFSNNWAY